MSKEVKLSDTQRSRATTDEQKREVIERLLAAWEKVPQLRLGQLIQNCVDTDIFYIEDYPLVKGIEEQIELWGKSEAS